MPHPVAHLSLALAMLVALAAPARAELSAARLWENWRTVAAAAGQSLTAGREEPGQRSLVLHDLRSVIARDGMASESHLAWMRLDERSDGSVRVTLAEEARFESRFRDAAGREGVLAMRLSQNGTEIVVRETEAGLEQALGAERMALGDLVLLLEDVRQDIALELVSEGLTTRSDPDSRRRAAGGARGARLARRRPGCAGMELRSARRRCGKGAFRRAGCGGSAGVRSCLRAALGETGFRHDHADDRRTCCRGGAPVADYRAGG
ncbi:MAG: hypothetical protein CVT80_12745 [Alphaproteobacteria bacterium HGW-Alphaproteobacteria-2]|nr:MAG: hypothetical protein CVT80_12745 [Alphaproteobacteria bacterium HGW-Alphaproteobacteria-2]